MQGCGVIAPAGPRRSRAQLVAAEVEEEILAARLPVGAHLGRRSEFMQRFGISPTIMNETLRILRDSGLVDVRRGNRGGLFVASLPPQIRLGAMDLWFTGTGTSPLDLFEARVHLERTLTPLAFDRCDGHDVGAMRVGLEVMARAGDARSYLAGVMQVHRAIVIAARVPVLDGMHEAIVALLAGSLTRAVFVPGHEEMLRHSLFVHTELVDAISGHDRTTFDKLAALHDDDLVRADDPGRSPHLPAGGH